MFFRSLFLDLSRRLGDTLLFLHVRVKAQGVERSFNVFVFALLFCLPALHVFVWFVQETLREDVMSLDGNGLDEREFAA